MNNAPTILFDMDDTLAATAAHWRKAETALLASLGRPWDAQLSRSYKGMNALDVAVVVHREIAPANISASDCQATMRGALREAFKTAPPAPMQGGVDCARRLTTSHRMALASGSPLELIELTLNHLGIIDCFELLLSSESVARGKPNPDVFLAAADKLQVPPAECVVIEDSLIGVQAARAAGMRCIAIPSSEPEPFRDIAHRICKSLDEVDSQLIHDVQAM